MKGLTLSTVLFFLLMLIGLVIAFRSAAEHDHGMMWGGLVLAAVGIVGLVGCGIGFLIID